MGPNLLNSLTGIDTSDGEFPIRIEFDPKTTAMLAFFIMLAVMLGVILAKRIGG